MNPLSLIKALHTVILLTLFTISSSALAFTDLEGKVASIQSYLGKGKWTIVEVWTSDCHSCRQHMPSMVKFDGKLKNVRFLGISLDSSDHFSKTKAFLTEFEIKFPTLISNPIEVNAWMLENIGESLIGTPTFILFDEKGELSAVQAGIVSVEKLESFILKNSATE